MSRLLLTSVVVFVLATPPALAEAPAAGSAEISYHRDIKPIFRAKCFGCHQPAKQGGELDMTRFAAMLAGGESGEPSIVPGKPEASYLVELITPSGDRAPEMPQKGDPLTASDIDRVRRWIAAGAEDDSPAEDEQQITADKPPVYENAPVVTSIDFSPDGAMMAVSGYHEVLLHSADGGALLGRLVGLSERIESAVFSPDGKQLAVTGGSPGRLGELQIWDVDKRSLKLSLPVTYDTIYGASWSPNGKLVAFGCGDHTLRAVDAASGEQVLFQGAHNDWVFDTVFSKEGTHLVSVSRDRSMKLTEVATARFIDNITSITPGALKGGLHAVDRHPTADQLLIGGADGVPKIYRMFREKDRKIGDDFNLIRAFPALPGRIFAAEFNHDGSQIVAGSSRDGAGVVRVYNAADGKQIAELEGIEGGVYTATFSPDGKRIASGGFSGEVFLNDAATGKLFSKFIPVPLAGKNQGE